MNGDTFPIAIDVAAGLRNGFEVELEITGDEEVEVAVAIVIGEGAAGIPARNFLKQTSRLGDIGEGAVSIIAVEHVLAPIGDEQVFEAIVVVVAYAHRRRPAVAPEAGFLSYVRECAVAIVLVEPVSGVRGVVEATAAGEEDVEPAIVIVIEERGAAADGFDNIGFVIVGAVDDR